MMLVLFFIIGVVLLVGPWAVPEVAGLGFSSKTVISTIGLFVVIIASVAGTCPTSIDAGRRSNEIRANVLGLKRSRQVLMINGVERKLSLFPGCLSG